MMNVPSATTAASIVQAGTSGASARYSFKLSATKATRNMVTVTDYDVAPSIGRCERPAAVRHACSLSSEDLALLGFRYNGLSWGVLEILRGAQHELVEADSFHPRLDANGHVAGLE